MTFPRLKLRARIYSGYAVLVVVSLALSIFAVIEFSSVSAQMIRMNRLAENATIGLSISRDLEIIRGRILRYAVAADDAALREVMAAEKDAVGRLQAIAKATAADDKRRMYNNLEAGLGTFATKRAAFVEMNQSLRADRVKMLSVGPVMNGNADKLAEAARATGEPSIIAQAEKIQTSLTMVLLANWRFQSTRDPKAPAAFKTIADKAQGAIAAFDTSALPESARGLAAGVKSGLDSYTAAFVTTAENLLKSNDLYDNGLRPQLVSMGADVDKLEQGLEGGFKGAKQDTVDAIGTTIMVQEVVAGLAFLLSGLIGLLVGRSIANPVSGLTRAMERLAAGDNDAEIPSQDSTDALGQMARAVLTIRDSAAEKARRELESMQQRQRAEEDERRVREQERRAKAEADARSAEEQTQVVRILGEGLGKLAEGDLSFRLTNKLSETYKQIQEDFNAAIGRLQQTINAIASSTREVANASAEISTSTTDLSQRTEEQAASIEETSASLEQISVTVKKNAENAQQANQLAGGTREIAGRGGEVVAQAVQAMSRIEDSSRKISDIIGVIDEIARQTNLLALNAAVEAARAGEAGRGFAVVASEVRSLAQRSAQAAKDIKDLIVNSSSQVREGVDLVNRTGTALSDIVNSIKQVAEFVADIANASTQQATGIDQITKALTQMDTVTQQNSALVEENAATAKTLENQSTAMNEQVGFFRLGDSAEAAPKHAARISPQRKPAAASRPAPRLVPAPSGRGRPALAIVDRDPDSEEF